MKVQEKVVEEKETGSQHRFHLSEWTADGVVKEDGRREHALIWMDDGGCLGEDDEKT